MMIDITINHHVKFSKYYFCSNNTNPSSSSLCSKQYPHAINLNISQHTFKNLIINAKSAFGAGDVRGG